MKKIVIIGAGSAYFSLNSLVGTMKSRDLKKTELIVVDINEKRLKKIEMLANALNEKLNSNIKISATTDRKRPFLELIL